MKDYYDVDAILAEEELVPCCTLFDFSYLSHLDPDVASDHNNGKSNSKHLRYLPENSRVKIPLWAVEKWAMLGYVRLSLPRHYGRKARERLEADPSEVDLRCATSCGFMLYSMFWHILCAERLGACSSCCRLSCVCVCVAFFLVCSRSASLQTI
jgi:hypothetical protein